MGCTLHLECTWSGVGVYFYWWVIWPSPWGGILVYAYNIRSVFGVYTPVGVVTEWLLSVHSNLEWTLRQGKGSYVKLQWDPFSVAGGKRTYILVHSWNPFLLWKVPTLWYITGDNPLTKHVIFFHLQTMSNAHLHRCLSFLKSRDVLDRMVYIDLLPHLVEHGVRYFEIIAAFFNALTPEAK